MTQISKTDNSIQGRWINAVLTDSLENAQKLYHLLSRDFIITSFSYLLTKNCLDSRVSVFVSTSLLPLKEREIDALLDIIFSEKHPIYVPKKFLETIFIQNDSEISDGTMLKIFTHADFDFITKFFDIIISYHELCSTLWLDLAIEAKNKDLIKHIINDRKIDVNEISSRGELPLEVAVRNSIEITKYLIENGKKAPSRLPGKKKSLLLHLTKPSIHFS